MQSVENVIRQYVPLSSRATQRGWFTVKCQLCHDYKKRGGFKFNGEAVTYNCFNCAHAAVFDSNTHRQIPHKMLTVFDAYGIPQSDFNEILFDKFKEGAKQVSSDDANKVSIRFNDLILPDYFIPLDTNSKDIWHQVAASYLEIKRGIDPTSYPFLMLDKNMDVPTIEKANWKGRLLIPYFRHNKVIFYQGRDLMEDSGREKYLSPSEGRDSALYGFDELYRHTTDPLYVHEGTFDAMSIGNSIATFSNKLTEQQIELLNRCQRQKIIIPDRYGNGHILANQAIREDWSVSIPDVGGCKDVNEAVNKYGKLYVMKSIIENTCSGFTAETKVAMLCQK